ncbi:MAG TPA: erythromycin esterase family protein [Thermoanaerobaculia bacterium]|nr:erythromycin esterase family protein [Thermoanaerobaculia bacterium]
MPRVCPLLLVLLLVSVPALARLRAVRGTGDTSAAWLRLHHIADERLVDAAHGARIVAFGDATHGTHELFAAKQRWIPLFAARGYRTLALEAPYAQMVALDRWLATGDGDPVALLRNPSYFFWNTDELLGLLQWARAQNVAGLTPPFRIAGVDATDPAEAARLVIGAYPSLADRYACIERNAASAGCRNEIATIRPDLVALGAADEVLHAARVVEQGQEALARNFATRDATMAENVEWLAARDGRVLVWGHDVHWNRGTYAVVGPEPITAAGSYLHDAFFIGSVIGDGWFSSANAAGTQWLPQWRELDAPNGDDYALLFDAAAMNELLLPLANAPEWLRGAHHYRIAGSSGGTFGVTADLAQQFDAVLYVKTSTPAHVR